MATSIQELLPVPRKDTPIGVTAIENPFDGVRTLHEVPHGYTIADILRSLQVPERWWPQTLVLLDGDLILNDQWHCVRPKIGVRVVVRVLPGGGGNEFLRAFLMIAITVAAFKTGGLAAAGLGLPAGSTGALLASGVTAAVVTAGGLLAINALIPISEENFENGTSVSPTLSIGARANALKPFATMPVVLGRHRCWPPYAAKAATELVGRDQFLRLLFVVGYKDLEISEMKLGETDITTYDDVEYEILCGGASDLDQDGNAVTEITIFPDIVDEVTLNQKFSGPASPIEQTTELDTDEFSLDLTFPNGLMRIDKSGDRHGIAVSIKVEYKPVGGSYSTLTTIVTSASAPETIRKGYRYVLPSRGQYTVKLTRLDDDLDNNGTDQVYSDDCYLTAFRSITNENPVVHPNAALIALRIKATDQLSGAISDFNCVASSVLPDYDSGTDTWIDRETANPASLFRAVLEGVANARPLQTTSTVTTLDGTPIPLTGGGLWLQGSQSRIDLDDIETWHTECETAGREFNMYRDFSSTLWDTLHDICAAGRGRPRHINGLWSVVRDVEQSTPRQHFTPRNSYGFSGQKTYISMPHAFRMRFLNEDEGWQNDEVIVYDDGYSAANATVYETLELSGVTNANQLWKEGRYHLAVARLRPEVFTFQCDVESIAVTQGDMIRVSHDALLVGLGSGRIIAVTDNGTHATSIDVDDAFPMASASYAVRIRHGDDGSSTTHAVNAVVGEQTTLTFTTPILLASAPAVGDFVMYGETGLESIEVVVDSIIPGVDMSATITCYDAAPAVHTADVGEIPPFDSKITTPPGAAVPVIVSAVSDESALLRMQDGSLKERILVSFGFLNNRTDVRYLKMQHQRVGYPYGYSHPVLPGDVTDASITQVQEGETYDIRACYVRLDGTVGPWSDSYRHTVVGKTNPPPDVEQFYVERWSDGTRIFSWVLNNRPPDIAGFRIKYRLGTSGADWDTNMTNILDDDADLVAASPWETNSLAAGDYQIAIKAVDTGGRESDNANYISSSLGDPRIENALIVRNDGRLGWPGTKTDCYADTATQWLLPDGDGTWADLSTETWASWLEWNFDPVSSMEYETEAIDLGAIVNFDPLVSVTAGGSVTITETHSDNGSSWSSPAAVGDALTTRYIKIKVAITNPELDGITNMQIILSADTIEEEITDWDTSNDGAPVGDFRLPITKNYTLITTVQIALQNVGSQFTWEVIDKDATLGPNIKIWDNGATPSPALTDCTIDAVVKGL